jgi:hypothetical protein
MYLVWLVRWVGHVDDRIDGTTHHREPVGWYAKPTELPIPPSVGIYLMIHPDNDLEPVEQVIVTTEEAAVCVLPHEYCEGLLNLLDRNWPSYRDWLTDGWVYWGMGCRTINLGSRRRSGRERRVGRSRRLQRLADHDRGTLFALSRRQFFRGGTHPKI